jgi:hypothetical protein
MSGGQKQHGAEHASKYDNNRLQSQQLRQHGQPGRRMAFNPAAGSAQALSSELCEAVICATLARLPSLQQVPAQELQLCIWCLPEYASVPSACQDPVNEL